MSGEEEPRPPCDTCGAPATTLARDLTEATKPGDTIVRYETGPVKAGCDKHPVSSVTYPQESGLHCYWKRGDKVWFAHGAGPYKVKSVNRDWTSPEHGMVALEELPGLFASHVFVEQEPAPGEVAKRGFGGAHP